MLFIDCYIYIIVIYNITHNLSNLPPKGDTQAIHFLYFFIST